MVAAAEEKAEEKRAAVQPAQKRFNGWAALVALLIVGMAWGGWWLSKPADPPVAAVAVPPPVTKPVPVEERAPPPQPSKPMIGTLTIHSEPPGATIRVNGVFLGVAPQDFRHTEGAVEIDAALEGYQRHSESAQVKPSESREVVMRLSPNPQLPVVVSPPLPSVAGPPMVKITGGQFQMGSPKNEAERDSDEKQHSVTVKDFELGKHEVTVGQFRQFIVASGYKTDAEKEGQGCYVWSDSTWQLKAGSSWRNPNFKQGDDHPVVCVSWNDAVAYTRWLSEQTGQSYHLPTEAEWEYACRGGAAGQRYCGGDSPDRLAWYTGNSGDKTHPVGQKAANGFGLYDMSGNVWEWTCSAYDKDYGGAEKECTNNNTGGPLAVRGGGWVGRPAGVRSAFRDGFTPADRFDFTGFRLARSL